MHVQRRRGAREVGWIECIHRGFPSGVNHLNGELVLKGGGMLFVVENLHIQVVFP